MTDELITIIADEIDVFLRDRGMFIKREDLEDLADIVIAAVDIYEPEEDFADEDDDLWDEELEGV